MSQSRGPASYSLLLCTTNVLKNRASVKGDLFILKNMSRHIDTARRGVGQGVRDAGAVADDIQTGALGLEVVVYLDFHVIELDLNAVEQSVVIGGTGCDLVQSVDHFNDAV